MKSVAVAVFACLLLAILQPGLSIKCYNCQNGNGNCEEGLKECPSTTGVITITFDRCLKTKIGDTVTKSCSTKALCDAMKFCDNESNCEAHCCDSDECNSSSAVAPAFFLVTVAAMVTKLFL